VLGHTGPMSRPLHAHAHRHSAPAVSPQVGRWLRWATIGCALAVVVGILVLWPGDRDRDAESLDLAADPLRAEVTAVEQRPCSTDESTTCEVISFELREGPTAGTTGTIERASTSRASPGDGIQVIATELPDGEVVYSFHDFQRSNPLLLLGLLFVAAVVLLGRWRGVGALAGLALSLVVILGFALPSLVDGNNAVAVALVTAAAVAIVALNLAHGFGPATDVALLSSLASLALTGLLAWGFVTSAKFTGLTDDPAFLLDALGTDIDPRGIVLAGIVIGSLGVLDDVTVTQVSAVWELHANQPNATPRRLFNRALRIGRDHISSTVNTLFLAYAGAALPLLLLFSETGQSVATVATGEVVAVEIVRALVGSIGLVASVPISTWLATLVVTSSARLDPSPTTRPSAR
jgi:uncharacterized membrane protein